MRLNYTLLKETTNWSHNVKNGIYITEVKPTGRIMKALGFISADSDEVKWFKTALSIDTKNRKFKVL